MCDHISPVQPVHSHNTDISYRPATLPSEAVVAVPTLKGRLSFYIYEVITAVFHFQSAVFTTVSLKLSLQSLHELCPDTAF